MSRKKWLLNDINKELAYQLAEDCNIDPFVAFLAVSRGIETSSDLKDFLSNDTELIDPFELKDMDKAVDRINAAIYDFERIAVFGDYDADGVTATAVMYSYLEAQGADVVYYIPDRLFEGYGLSCEAIDKLNDMGVKLIITVDNGISSIEETKYAKQLGIDTVITDHHQAGDILPEAVAVVDPHRKDCNSSFKDWAGVGVAYKVVSAIEGGRPDELLQYFADLILIGTVADIVPLIGENRKLVKKGLEMMNSQGRIGIDAIKEVSGIADKEITSGRVAFGITPRINAVGRMGSAETALKLLLSEDADDAFELAKEIDEKNALRQRTEQSISAEAEEILKANPNLIYDRVIVVAGKNWHNGVTGIVASRLVEKYGKPCIVVSVGDDGVSRGSGRSVEGFSLYDALAANPDLFVKFGGHTMAAGMTIKSGKLDEFRASINEYAKKVGVPAATIKLDCRLNPATIDENLLESLQILEPYGADNPQPLFELKSMQIVDIQPVGNGKHLKISLTKKEKSVTAMKFGVCVGDFPFMVNDVVDLAVKIEKNEFMGKIKPSIHIIDMKISDTDDDELISSKIMYERYKSGNHLSTQDVDFILPQRDDIAKVYKYIKMNGGWKFEKEILYSRIGKSVNLAKIMISVDVLDEMGIFRIDENAYIYLPDKEEKVDLADSEILSNLKKLKG